MNLYNLRNKIVSLAPNLAATEHDSSESEAEDINETLSKEDIIEPEAMATFSPEQFQQILAAIGITNKSGSFTQCTARFNGQRDPAAVEEFLTAIHVYKDIEKISDADALRGMPLLLEDYAASWWIGVKDTVRTFEEAETLIRTTFSPPIPDWRIFATVFETKQQKNEPTDSFLCKKRLLMSQFKATICEEVQINLIYGLMNLKIRDRVRREHVKTFQELIAASREAKLFFLETPTEPNAGSDVTEDQTISKRCSFCRLKGHSSDACHKKKKKAEEERETMQQEKQPQQNKQQPQQKSLQPEQSQSIMRKPTFSCYGCGAPGVYRSNCSTCSTHAKESPQYLAFNSLSSTIIGHALPTVHIEMFGLKGEAVFDSGAKTSVASTNLKQILTKNGCVFQDVKADITLADGTITTGKVMSTICDIAIGNRIRKIRIIYLPNATKNRTLIGTDFLEQAGIVLNMAQKCWYFEDEPKRKYEFTNPLEVGLFSMDLNSQDDSPGTQEMTEMSDFIQFVEKTNRLTPLPRTPEMRSRATRKANDYSPHSIQEIFDGTLPVGSTTPPHSFSLFLSPIRVKSSDDALLMKPPLPPPPKPCNNYSPHSVQAIFKNVVPAGQRTPRESSRLFAPPAKIKRTKQNDYLDTVFMPFLLMDIRLLNEGEIAKKDKIDKTEMPYKMFLLLMPHRDVFGIRGGD